MALEPRRGRLTQCARDRASSPRDERRTRTMEAPPSMDECQEWILNLATSMVTPKKPTKPDVTQQPGKDDVHEQRVPDQAAEGRIGEPDSSKRSPESERGRHRT